MTSRLKDFIHYTTLTERAFALKCGIPQNTMNYYLSGQRKPSYEAVEKILATFPDLSAEWLTRGNGNMLLLQNGTADLQADRLEKLVDTIATLQDVINMKSELVASLNDRIKQLEAQLKK